MDYIKIMREFHIVNCDSREGIRIVRSQEGGQVIVGTSYRVTELGGIKHYPPSVEGLDVDFDQLF